MLKTVQNSLLYWDHVAWFFINTRWHNSLFDLVLPFIRNQWFWAPLYFFLLLFMPSRFGKKGWVWCLFFIISFAISDQVSAHLLKPLFQRLRPCNTPYLYSVIRTLVPCGGGYSFPSSHAANHFALAVFGIATLKFNFRRLWIPAVLWAAAVSYAQVYVGVHFPLDVLCGAIIGILTGMTTGAVFNRYFRLPVYHPEQPAIAN